MLISRIFSTSGDATDAADDLKKAGFREEAIHLTDASSGAVTEADIVKLGVVESRATTYAEALASGGTLLILEAPVGTGTRAAEVLERSRSGDTGTPKAEFEGVTRPETTGSASWTGAAPLSERLGWPVLVAGPTSKSSSFGFPLLCSGSTPLSSWLGIKVLSDNPTPLSNWLGKKVLSDDPTPLSTWLGKGTLIDDPTPLSSRLKMRLLSDDPAPAKATAAPAAGKKNGASGHLASEVADLKAENAALKAEQERLKARLDTVAPAHPPA